MTGWEVLDTAIKIGLGGTLTLIGSWIGWKRELKSEHLRRRLDAIESISEKFEVVATTLIDAANNALHASVGTRHASRALAMAQDNDRLLGEIRALEGRLILFDLTKAAEELTAFRNAIGAQQWLCLEVLKAKRKFTVEECKRLGDAGKTGIAARDKFHRLLSAGHKSLSV